MKRTLFEVVGVCALSLAINVSAEELSQDPRLEVWRNLTASACQPGLEAAKGNRLVQAVELWQRLSPYRGLSERHYVVSKCLILTGVSKSDKGTRQWYEAAADAGSIDAELLLAFDYFKDVNIFGVDARDVNVPELNESIHWANVALKHGSADAKAFLALNYLTGLGVERDLKKGLDLLTEAANEGSLNASESLAFIYRQGLHGERQNRERHKYWCGQAIALAKKLDSKLVDPYSCPPCE